MSGFFESAKPVRTVTHGKATFQLPILYFRDDFFALFFSADPKRIRAVMPSSRLHPVLLNARRAMVGIGAFNYIDTSIGSYGEVAVVIPAVYGPSPPSILIPALVESRWQGFGLLVMHLPVTKRVARDAGRGEWGYTKFLAGMRFVITPEYMECRMSEGEKHILTIRVVRRGIAIRDCKPLITFSVKEGNLIRTTIPQKGTCRFSIRPAGSFLKLGDHPVSASIRELGISEKPFMSRYYLERSGILPSGQIMEQDVKPLDGYPGKGRPGKHSVIYTSEE
jgi:hypothetical protein